MTLDAFAQSTSSAAPPAGLSGALRGLWHDARGDWDQAHACAQADESPAGAWVHAYLHRKEGDVGNARYWYQCAGRAPSSSPLSEEWASIASALLSATS